MRTITYIITFGSQTNTSTSSPKLKEIHYVIYTRMHNTTAIVLPNKSIHLLLKQTFELLPEALKPCFKIS